MSPSQLENNGDPVQNETEKLPDQALGIDKVKIIKEETAKLRVKNSSFEEKGYFSSYFKSLALASGFSILVLFISVFFGSVDVPIIGNLFKKVSDYVTISQSEDRGNINVQNLDSSNKTTQNTESKLDSSTFRSNSSNSIKNLEQKETVRVFPLWYYPLAVFMLFVLLAYLADRKLKKEIEKGDSSESEIDRIIDKYEGVVDAIGTALPLIGAAVILFTVGAGRQEGSSTFFGNAHNLFLGFAVPFEIKSIFILAIAKLFESVFDEMALHYQEIMEKVKNKEKAFRQSNDRILKVGSDLTKGEIGDLQQLVTGINTALNSLKVKEVSEILHKHSRIVVIDSDSYNSKEQQK